MSTSRNCLVVTKKTKCQLRACSPAFQSHTPIFKVPFSFVCILLFCKHSLGMSAPDETLASCSFFVLDAPFFTFFASFCWVFHAQRFPVFIKDRPPPKGNPANGRPAVENGLLMKEAKGGWHELCRETYELVGQLTVQYNIGAGRPIK